MAVGSGVPVARDQQIAQPLMPQQPNLRQHGGAPADFFHRRLHGGGAADDFHAILIGAVAIQDYAMFFGHRSVTVTVAVMVSPGLTGARNFRSWPR